MYTYEDLLGIISKLRSEEGCPWDREQTHESMIPCMIEETYEAVEAIKNEDMPNLKEELGDMLLQVLMQAEIAKEAGAFTIEDVIEGIASKLVYRHPHVFGDTKVEDSGEVLERWEELKKKEKKEKTQTEAMESIPKALPALIRASKIQKKATQVGFMWEEVEPVFDKVLEELEEVRVEVGLDDQIRINEEMGDLLFATVNLSCFLGVNPELALTNTIEKFINRFRYIENKAFEVGKDLTQLTLEEMDSFWETCKETESKS